MSNENLSFSTNSGKCSTFMNSHQKLPRRAGAPWLKKPVSKSSISYRNRAVKQGNKQTKNTKYSRADLTTMHSLRKKKQRKISQVLKP